MILLLIMKSHFIIILFYSFILFYFLDIAFFSSSQFACYKLLCIKSTLAGLPAVRLCAGQRRIFLRASGYGFSQGELGQGKKICTHAKGTQCFRYVLQTIYNSRLEWARNTKDLHKIPL